MMKSYLLGALCACGIIFISLPSNAALVSRLETSPGSGVFQAYYDDQLGITWTTDSKINGVTTWDNQFNWITGLVLNGVGGWRLPNMDVNDDGIIVSCGGGSTSATQCLDNEYGYMYWENGITHSTPGPFLNVSGNYWSSTGGPPQRDIFGFNVANIGVLNVNGGLAGAWAVADGDVFTPVPIPPALWLFGSGLLGLIGITINKAA